MLTVEIIIENNYLHAEIHQSNLNSGRQLVLECEQ